ncbi:hypothetical protein ACH5RR_038827 [Cinchona calisaya]|uniref:Lil3 protein n=1 Tax=Cinchona calisaya TaxID=153742 RepID=A0ABD2XZX4_9GENT
MVYFRNFHLLEWSLACTDPPNYVPADSHQAQSQQYKTQNPAAKDSPKITNALKSELNNSLPKFFPLSFFSAKLTTMSIALFSSPPTTHLPSLSSSPHSTSNKTQLPHLKPFLSLRPKRQLLFWVFAENEAAASSSSAAIVGEDKPPSPAVVAVEEKVSEISEKKEESLGSNGPVKVAAAVSEANLEKLAAFQDSRWINGTWDLTQFQKDGETGWDAVIDAEARRRKWLENNPESSSNEDPVVFDTSIIPWWAWIKRYHLPEAELLNGRAAMIGFFSAYLVDSLTGVGLVNQMGNFFCKTLLFVAVVGVLVIRKNEDIETVKKLLEESTFYDKQWQATWQDGTSSSSKKD